MKFILAPREALLAQRSTITLTPTTQAASKVIVRVSKTSPYLKPTTLENTSDRDDYVETGFTLQTLSDRLNLPILDYAALKTVHAWLTNRATPYRTMLIDCMLLADTENFECLRKSYPTLVDMVDVWRNMGDEFVLGAGHTLKWD